MTARDYRSLALRTNAGGVVVEFAGLPGAGKTTLAAHTLAALVERGVPCTLVDAAVSASVRRPVRALRRAALASAQLSTHPMTGIAALRTVAASGQESVRDGLAGAVQWLVVQRLAGQARRRSGMHLLEEGAVQTLWTLGLRSRLDGTGNTLPRLAPTLADLVVVVDAPLDQLVWRLGQRASRHSRTQRLAEPARSTELQCGSRLLEEIMELTTCGRLRLANDGSATPQDLGRQVADWVVASTDQRCRLR
jgi:hypothetical protein